MRRLPFLVLSPAAAVAAPAEVYTLGELQVTARSRSGELIGGSVVAGEDLRRFDKTSLDQALDFVPGGRGRQFGRLGRRPTLFELALLGQPGLPLAHPGGKGALRWRVSDATALHASVSSPTRFPTPLGAVPLPLRRRVADRSIVAKWRSIEKT